MTKKGGVLETPPEDELAAVIASGDNDRVKELLEFGVDPNARGEHESFIAIACRAGNHVAVTRLIAAGGTCSRPMLADAIGGDNPRCADKVLDELHYAGLEIDIDIEAGQLLLRRGFVAKLGVPMLTWLERQGVDLSVRTQQGNTLHDIAVRDGASAEVVAFLAERA